LNFNGKSTVSPTFDFNACVAPSNISAPFLIEATVNRITIGFEEPINNGGCPLTGFAVFRDDGNNGPVETEVNIDNDPAIRSNPILRRIAVTSFPSSSEGLYFRFKIRAYNREGFVDSTFLKVLNAGRPSTPTSAPTLLAQSDSAFSVSMPTIDPTNNNHSPIVSYNL
jgi:hypothetical protein